VAELREGQGIRTFRGDSGRAHSYSELLSRMSRLIEVLEPHQRNYHLCLRVNIYWYIEKHKEIELLLSRLVRQTNPHLRHYLDGLCVTVSRKIEEDERVAVEFLGGNGQAK
jgi:hypothetical protein